MCIRDRPSGRDKVEYPYTWLSSDPDALCRIGLAPVLRIRDFSNEYGHQVPHLPGLSIRIHPVSYTHLDVYKRQTILSAIVLTSSGVVYSMGEIGLREVQSHFVRSVSFALAGPDDAREVVDLSLIHILGSAAFAKCGISSSVPSFLSTM